MFSAARALVAWGDIELMLASTGSSFQVESRLIRQGLSRPTDSGAELAISAPALKTLVTIPPKVVSNPLRMLKILLMAPPTTNSARSL